MKNVTLSADEDLIEQARQVARSQRRTLNAAFREWLLAIHRPEPAVDKRWMLSCGGFATSRPAVASAGTR